MSALATVVIAAEESSGGGGEAALIGAIAGAAVAVALLIAGVVWLARRGASSQPAVATAGPAAPRPVPAGWYPDPRGESRLRYWDGSEWTAHTAA